MNDPTPKFAVNVRPAIEQSIAYGGCNLLNRDDRLRDDLLGERVLLYALPCEGGAVSDFFDFITERPEAVRDYLQSIDGDERATLEERYFARHLTATVRIQGWVDPHEESWDIRQKYPVGGQEWSWLAGYDNAGRAFRETDVHDNPWWSDDTPIAWLLDDPQPIEPVYLEEVPDDKPGAVWELPDEVREQIGGRDE